MKKILLLFLTLPNLLQSSSGSPAQTSAAGAPELPISAQKTAVQTKEIAALKNILPIPELHKLVMDYFGTDYEPISELSIPYNKTIPDQRLSFSLSEDGQWLAILSSLKFTKEQILQSWKIGIWKRQGTTFIEHTNFDVSEAYHSEPTPSLAISPHGEYLALGRQQPTIYKIPQDAHTQLTPQALLIGQQGGSNKVFFFQHAGITYLVAKGTFKVNIFQNNSGQWEEIQKITAQSLGRNNGIMGGIAISSDGEILLLTFRDVELEKNILLILRAQKDSKKLIYKTDHLHETAEFQNVIAISEDKKYVASSSAKVTTIWKLEDNKLLKHQVIPLSASYLKFSKSGQMLCIRTENKVEFWKKNSVNNFELAQTIPFAKPIYDQFIPFIPTDADFLSIGNFYSQKTDNQNQNTITLWHSNLPKLENPDHSDANGQKQSVETNKPQTNINEVD